MKVLFLLLLSLPLISSCTSGPIAKATLDEEVKRLCAIDGGVRVEEKVILKSNEYDDFIKLRIPSKEGLTSEDKYYYEWDVKYYKRGNPELWRSEHRIVRVYDRKVMGVLVRYSRRGGDISGPWHDSSFSCPEIGSHSLERSIFTRGE